MTIAITVIFIITALTTLTALGAELRRDLMMLQQNSYMPERYRRWLSESGDTTSYVRLIGMAVFLAACIGFSFQIWAIALMLVFSSGLAITLLRRKYKKPLVVTPRVRRIYATEWALSLLVIVAYIILFTIDNKPKYGSEEIDIDLICYIIAICATGLYCASHIVTIVAVTLLSPVEKRINRGYYDDAARILRSMPDLKIIGVTGSYGKTSTKHYLKAMLDTTFDVAMTPGNFNTTLGVIRTVREHLKPYNEVFIVEMGAKRTGDIKEICDLVHPTYGIVTAVGEQHLESFGSIENVQRTKFELIDSLPADGLGVINDDFAMAASRKVDNVRTLRYALKNTGSADFTAEDIRYNSRGTDFTLVDRRNGSRTPMHTRLVGECNVSNLIAAAIIALELGVPAEKIRYAVEQLEQVEHRLSIRRIPGGITIIDDAYNSNPTGSAMALDVLSAMKEGKRIIITPGMIELGLRQDELNKAFGAKIATSADEAIIVGHYNRQAICEGLREAGMSDDHIHLADTFGQAQQILASLSRPGDTVLYENDLPDTFK